MGGGGQNSFLTPSPKQHITSFAYAGVVCMNSHSYTPQSDTLHAKLLLVFEATVNKDSVKILIPTLLSSGGNLCSQPVQITNNTGDKQILMSSALKGSGWQTELNFYPTVTSCISPVRTRLLRSVLHE